MPPANAVADAANDSRPATVNVDVSDLFFNRDLDACRVLEKGEFVGWDNCKLREEADSMLCCLDRLGVQTPDADALVEDFLARC